MIFFGLSMVPLLKYKKWPPSHSVITGWSKETVTNESFIKSLQLWFSLISGVFLGSIYWAVCVSKRHCIKTGNFGWYRQFSVSRYILRPILNKFGKTQNWQFIYISLCDLVCPSKLIFVWPRWCRQVSLFADINLGHFPFWGAHLQKGLKSSLSGRRQSTEQMNGHFPEKQRHSKICQDTCACSDSMWVWKANRPVYGT